MERIRIKRKMTRAAMKGLLHREHLPVSRTEDLSLRNNKGDQIKVKVKDITPNGVELILSQCYFLANFKRGVISFLSAALTAARYSFRVSPPLVMSAFAPQVKMG